jgi:hypothetical protein
VGHRSARSASPRKGIGRDGLPWLRKQVEEATASGEDKNLTEADIASIVHDAVQGNLERLANDRALTGEWLVFAQHEGQNYYLCVGRHRGGDDFLRSQIDTVCAHEFPFLRDILV